MRLGDFSEVAAVYPTFNLYNPNTTVVNPANGAVSRDTFGNFTIPGNMISPIAKAIMNFYPKVNSKIDLNSNSLLDDYVQLRTVKVDRANYDGKLTWQRTK